MRPPLIFPSFFDLVSALNSDPYLLNQSETIVVAGTVYSADTIAAHSGFQQAARELWDAELPSSTGTEATGALPSAPFFPLPAPVAYHPTLDEICEWLNDQASASGQSAPQPNQPAEIPESSLKQALSKNTPFVPFNRLTEQQKNGRYGQAAQLFKAGRTVDFVQKVTGISRKKLLQYRRTVLGEKALNNLSLTAEQRESLYISLKTETPQNWGMPEPIWCTRTLQTLVERRFEVTLSFADASVLYRHLLDARAFTPRGTTIYIESQTESGTETSTESQTEAVTSAQQTQQRYWHRSRLSDKALRERVKAALAKGMDQKTAAELFDVKPTTVKEWVRQLRAASKLTTVLPSHTLAPPQTEPSGGISSSADTNTNLAAHNLEERWEDIEEWLSAQSPNADAQAQGDQNQHAQPTSTPSPASSQGSNTLAELLLRPTKQTLPPAAHQPDQRPFLSLTFDEKMDRFGRVIAMLLSKHPIGEVSIKCRVPRDKVGQIRHELLAIDRASNSPLITVELDYLAIVLFSHTPSSYGFTESYWSTGAVQQVVWQRLNLSLSPAQVEQVRIQAQNVSGSYFGTYM